MFWRERNKGKEYNNDNNNDDDDNHRYHNKNERIWL